MTDRAATRSAIVVGVIGLVIGVAALANAVDPIVGRVSAPPATLTPGRPWDAAVTLERSGRRLTWLRPTLTIERGRVTEEFDADPAGRGRTYRVRVIFPSAGRWSYSVRVGADTVARGTAVVHSGPRTPSFLGPGGP